MSNSVVTDGNALPLQGLRVLVVEDEFLIAQEISLTLKQAGCEVMGPVPFVDDARALVAEATPDGAVLDVNLHGELIFSFAEDLLARRVPLVFASGYDSESFPAAFRQCHFVLKPFREGRLREVVLTAFVPR
jgi:two-component SAPR family response regulator